ncbi:DUF87 domain-containing protein [Helicobacter cholecystus]|uniref:DUF87 domain-containing protein n=1 Tax=Helicobacter cholecystus TaxID=45498 RepID=A0A3D8IWH4_9HELI|nr:DUF87 domain-containing protein [Helicobacter cholecystus]RDU69306.1 DUF87 domain-containing protein [Helicobacter cholecystus]VEJ24384.1 Type IV secretory pathway, VirB4 components [Helicobacter cholecystus]
MLVGKIVSIQFNQFRVKIFSNVRGGALNLQGEIYYFGNIGSYLKTSNPLGEEIICEVIAIFDSDKQDIEQNFDLNSNRELLLKPIGIYKNENFTLGIGVYPSLYSDVSLLTSKDLEKILMSTQEDEAKSESIHLGISKNHINHPVSIQIDKFFGIHSAVLGNSGSGKSNTIAHLLQEVYRKDRPANKSKIIIFDVNGEYNQAFSELASQGVGVKLFKPNLKESENGVEPFYMPHFLLSLDEWCAFLMATDATQKPFWEKVLQEAYRFYKIEASENYQKYIQYFRRKFLSLFANIVCEINSDTALVGNARSLLSDIKRIIKIHKSICQKFEEEGFLQDLDKIDHQCTLHYSDNQNKIKDTVQSMINTIGEKDFQDIVDLKMKNGEFLNHHFLKIASEMVLAEEETKGNRSIRGYVATMMNRLDIFIDDPEYAFMRGGYEDFQAIKNKNNFFSYFWEKEEKQQQLVIIDTSELGKDTLETLTSVIARLVFEYRKKQEGGNRRKNPVHLVLDEAHRYIKKDQKYLLKDNVFERIAREGRKYSLYLLISSQRPSELSETVLSQCANFIIHRIQNENDMRHINAVLPYFSEDFVSKIKQSVAGEALVFGDFIPMPMHIKIQKANPEPHSSNCQISQEWYSK